jgi:hypothetical protein
MIGLYIYSRNVEPLFYFELKQNKIPNSGRRSTRLSV